MKRHPKMYKPVLILVASRWLLGSHYGTTKGSGEANYFVSGHSKRANSPLVQGCHWLKPDRVKPLRRKIQPQKNGG